MNFSARPRTYEDVISTVDFFHQSDPSTALSMEEVRGLQRGLY